MRVGDHQRRRREIVGAHVGVDAAFEVAIAREHRGGDQIAVVDRLGILRRQRTGIADAGGAAEADQIEAELVEILLQAGLLEIFADHLRAGRQRGLHPRLGGQALGRGLARQQAGADHHARIGRVGAGGDRRDHHVAVADVVVLALDRHALLDLGTLVEFLVHRIGKAGFHFLQRDAILRTLRTGQRRLDRAEIELEDVGEHRIGRGLDAEHALRLGIGRHQRDHVRPDGRCPSGNGWCRRRSARSRRSRRIPATCCRAWRGRRS